MRPIRIWSLLIALLAIAANFNQAHAGQTISVNFMGRVTAGPNGPTDPLAPTDVAGVVAVGNWNNIDDAYGTNGTPLATFAGFGVGTTAPLVDSTGTATTATLSFVSSDAWNDNGDDNGNTVTTANARMMLGDLKSTAGATDTFRFSGLTDGQYDIYVYLAVDNDNTAINVYDWDGATTNYVVEMHTFSDTSTFVQSGAGTPTARILGNYTVLHVDTFGRKETGFNATHISGGNGVGIPGIQLVYTGPSGVNALPVQIIAEPPAGRRIAAGDGTQTISVGVEGPVFFQGWFKNGSAIPGANGTTYTIPAPTIADNGAMFTFVATNNVNSVTSAPTVLTVGKKVVIPGFIEEKLFYGHVRADIEDPTFDFSKPDIDKTYNIFESTIEQGDNFAERLNGLFVPQVDGDYVFFVCSDDDSDLWLSTDSTPQNKVLIAQEAGWSNPLLWLTASSGDATLKRSDTLFSPGIHLLAGQNYYIEADHHEGGGGDEVDANFKLAADPDPADGTHSKITGPYLGAFVGVLDGAFINVTTQPASVTVVQGNSTTLTAAAMSGITGDTVVTPPAITYAWQAAAPGSSTFTNIPNASGTAASPLLAKYVTPFLTVSDSGTQVRLSMTANDASSNTPPATLTVIPDTFPPTLVSAGGMVRNTGVPDTNSTSTTYGTLLGSSDTVEVDLIFNKPLDTSTVVVGNFSLSAGTVTAVRYVTNATGLASRKFGVVLSTTGLTAGSSYTVSINNISDLIGNKVTNAITSPITVSKMEWAALGLSQALDVSAGAPDALNTGANAFNLISGGNGFWATEDDVTYIYEKVSGDVDRIVNVTYADPASNWARGGLHIRESLDSIGTVASRYQNIHADPWPVKFDGTAANNSFETNRRIHTGDATTSSNGGFPPDYPNAWMRLRRSGNIVNMYYGHDGITWNALGFTDFDNVSDTAGTPLPATMLMGLVYSPENNNISTTDPVLRKDFAIDAQNYGVYGPNKAEGKQTYSIGVHFQDTSVGSALATNEVAGVDAVAQSQWNNSYVESPADGSLVSASVNPMALVADQGGAGVTTSATVDWAGSGNTWATTGRGEENNTDSLVGSDHLLMQGYLDSGNATTTTVHFTALPSQLTSGYDVVVYAMGSVSGRGGGYTVYTVDGSGNTNILSGPVTIVTPTISTNWIQAPNPTLPGNFPPANYAVFTNIKASDIYIDASTANGLGFSGTPRSPINAVQLVAPSGLLTSAPPVNPTISLTSDTSGNITLTFTGTLQAAATVNGPYTDVAGATSPKVIPAGSLSGNKFWRARQ